MRVAVGCPVRDRAWILPDWLEHVRAAFAVAGVDPIWAFAIGIGPNGEDDGTYTMLGNLIGREGGGFIRSDETELPPTRTWNQNRYEQMVVIRNKLLTLIRDMQPDYFLSVDSDILLHPAALTGMLDLIQRRHWDACGSKAYLSETNKDITTFGEVYPGTGIRRYDTDGNFQTMVLMAIKLMTPVAYNIDYAYNMYGEDVGWSLNCKDAGLTLGWDGRVCSKHVMSREKLGQVDPKVGW